MRRISRVLLLVAVLMTGLTIGQDAKASDSFGNFFPIGWYEDFIPSHLPDVALDGMNAVLPYDGDGGPVTDYLNQAQSNGLRAMLEVPRFAVNTGNVAAVTGFVNAFKNHPALLGWYLADEPQVNPDLANLTPATATTLYNAIKANDPNHPVAMAFNPFALPINNPPHSLQDYAPSYDIIMFNDYPCNGSYPTFGTQNAWLQNLIAVDFYADTLDKDFIPIMQAIDQTAPGSSHLRICTAAEVRYYTYTSMQAGAAGVFWWIRSHSPETFRRAIIRPIVYELKQIARGLADGPFTESTSVVAQGDAVVGTTYHEDGNIYDMIVSRQGPGDGPVTLDFGNTCLNFSRYQFVSSPVQRSLKFPVPILKQPLFVSPFPKSVLSPAIRDALLWLPILNGQLTINMGPYDVRVLRLQANPCA